MDEINGILTIAIFLPIIAALAIVMFFKGKTARNFALVISIIELLITGYIFLEYRSDPNGYRFIEKIDWIPIESFKTEYLLGVDGLSAPLLLLTGLLGLISIFASWSVTSRMKEHFTWLLILQGSVIGVFTSLDFFLFFLFWELELIPMFFLISIWGSGRKEYSAMKFLIFTILGSAFMLIGLLAIYASAGTFDMRLLPDLMGSGIDLIIPASWLFLLTIIGFAVKLPVFPFHTWLPDAHTDAPTAASVMLAGVLLKMGGYGMFRVSASMFPEQLHDFSFWIAIFGLINIIYGAIVTIRQTDLKRLIAYSSISHMGFILLGLAAASGSSVALGFTGAAMQMFTHGTITGLMFLTVGFIYERTHTRNIPDLGGLATKMPIFAVSMLIAGLASLGLPGTSGFVSEILIFMGSFAAWKFITAIATIAVVLTAGYILWMIQRAIFEKIPSKFNSLTDAQTHEIVPIAMLIISILFVGIYPAFISDIFTLGLEDIVASVEAIN